LELQGKEKRGKEAENTQAIRLKQGHFFLSLFIFIILFSAFTEK